MSTEACHRCRPSTRFAAAVGARRSRARHRSRRRARATRPAAWPARRVGRRSAGRTLRATGVHPARRLIAPPRLAAKACDAVDRARTCGARRTAVASGSGAGRERGRGVRLRRSAIRQPVRSTGSGEALSIRTASCSGADPTGLTMAARTRTADPATGRAPAAGPAGSERAPERARCGRRCARPGSGTRGRWQPTAIRRGSAAAARRPARRRRRRRIAGCCPGSCGCRARRCPGEAKDLVLDCTHGSGAHEASPGTEAETRTRMSQVPARGQALSARHRQGAVPPRRRWADRCGSRSRRTPDSD